MNLNDTHGVLGPVHQTKADHTPSDGQESGGGKVAPVSDLPVELRGVADELAAGDGFWRSCSGCHELNEGHPTGAYSEVFRCHLGLGCRECGGLGAVWDDTDYDAMADFIARADGQRTGAAAASVGQAAPDGVGGKDGQ